MGETLQEFVDSRGVTMRVDRPAGVLRSVKVLGLRSRNGRMYLDEALRRAVALYEGAKVNVNHPKADPLAARDYRDRIGNLRNVAVRAGEGLFADFHFNPKHALAEQLIWDAEHAPENVGLSHNVLARTARRGDQTVVEAITRVQSVDLVADPATTQGLFESVAEPNVAAEANEIRSVEPDSAADEPTDAVTDRDGPAAEIDDGVSPADGAAALPVSHGTAAESVESFEQLRAELAEAKAELTQRRVSESRARRLVLIHQLLDESGLSDAGNPGLKKVVVTERFRETLLAAPDEPTVRELVRDRLELVERFARATYEAASPAVPGDRGGSGTTRPCSRDQSLPTVPSPSDARAFVRAIT
ncbi:MAG TPA: hypothetical protein DD670_12225 [Planctomycetaceae bacterium]|nr:hypothetical protein [Planctomycetaceae bacterium]